MAGRYPLACEDIALRFIDMECFIRNISAVAGLLPSYLLVLFAWRILYLSCCDALFPGATYKKI